MSLKYEFPQVAPRRITEERGISSLHHPNVGTLRFRSNPKEFNWSYTLNKRVEQTYGGRVIQLLGTRIDDFSFKADSGALGRSIGGQEGGWPYAHKVMRFMRDVMVAQRNGVPATFEYTTRGWRFNAYVVSIPFADAVEEVLREFEIGLKVQEDVSGLMSRNLLQAELARLQDGIGFHRSKYNDPRLGNNNEVADPEQFSTIQQMIDMGNSIVQTVLNPNYLPDGAVGTGNNLLSNLFGAGGAGR